MHSVQKQQDAMDDNYGRRITDTTPAGACPHNCPVCLKMQLQVKWILTGAILAISTIGTLASITIVNRGDINNLNIIAATSKMQNEYLVQSVNDVKRAMGLEVRMPSKLEALK